MNDPHDVFFDYHSSQNDNYLMSSPIPCQNFQEVSLGSPTSNNNSKRVKSMFTKKEDTKLIKLVKEYGSEDWALISSFFKDRTRRQCRERWNKYLCPSLNHSPWTSEEDELLLKKYNQVGPKWTLISKSFKNRTDINIKSRYIYLKRKIKKNNNSFDFHQESTSQQTIQNNFSTMIPMCTSSLKNSKTPINPIEMINFSSQPSTNQINQLNQINQELSCSAQSFIKNSESDVKNVFTSNSEKQRKESLESLEYNSKEENSVRPIFSSEFEISDFSLEHIGGNVDYFEDIFDESIFFDF